MHYPNAIKNLIDNFSALPGIGGKTAERLVFYLLKNCGRGELINFGNNLMALPEEINICEICGNLKDNNHCSLCDDMKRDKSVICLVAENQDIFCLEKTKTFNGLYHVLGGLISSAQGVTAEKLNIAGLLKRLENISLKEVLFGFNPTVEGESTMLFLKKIIKEKFPGIKLTRLSRGLPMGGDLEYADEITLGSAIKNRSEV